MCGQSGVDLEAQGSAGPRDPAPVVILAAEPLFTCIATAWTAALRNTGTPGSQQLLIPIE